MVADLTLQVRSDAADAAMSDLRALGKVTTEASGSQDVTEEYVDLALEPAQPAGERSRRS